MLSCLSCVQLLLNAQTVARQVQGFPAFPVSYALQADSSPLRFLGSPLLIIFTGKYKLSSA